ncbi:MAG: trypsin-like peptidase domain-containing protein, partial [Actinobacteria bacterium]|nr:trypsin-like peptidase domain-containing protein [Actinomycetota bacterium]
QKRRVKAADNKADDQYKLALWCEEHGLTQPMLAHLHRTLQLDPDREGALRRLGFQKVGSRWVNPEAEAALKALPDPDDENADSLYVRFLAQVEPPTTRDPGSIAGVVKRVGPAVVSIAVSTDNGFDIGSGVVIDRDGDVLTNNHVIAPAADGQGTIVVTFSDEATAKATIVGRDPTSDLAVIKVPNDQLTVAQLGDSDKLAVGDPVIAIGSPLGLQGTVTSGIVSALNRPVHAGATDGSDGAYLDAIQTDAAINPGNSGGALLDASGAVIGINSAGRFTASDGSGGQIPSSGIGYAIPINDARTVALELIHTGKAVHASLGVQGVTALAGQQVGAYIKQVAPNSAAAKAGLALGDVVVAADGQLVQSFEQLIVIVQQHKPGDRISLTYYPKDSAQTVTKTVTLG